MDVPVPLNATLALVVPVMVRSVVSTLAGFVGVKMNVMVQFAPALMNAPQFVLWRVKSAASPVVMVKPRLFCVLPPVLLMVTTTPVVGVPTKELGKFTGRGARMMVGPNATPVPVKGAVPVALPLTLKVSFRGPALPGVKVTETVQDAAAASVAPQVLALRA